MRHAGTLRVPEPSEKYFEDVVELSCGKYPQFAEYAGGWKRSDTLNQKCSGLQKRKHWVWPQNQIRACS